MTGEHERFLQLSRSEEAAALRHIFIAAWAADKSLSEAGAAAADLSRVGAIGGRSMGAGIATSRLMAGAEVYLIERDDDAVRTARLGIYSACRASGG